MTDRDPLEDLLIDAATVDRGRIAKALNGIYGIDAKTGAVVAQPGFNALGGREKVLAYLLARRVAVLLGKAAGETALPSEVSAGTGITGGSARPLLRRLLQGHEVSRDGDGGYHLSHHQIAGALAAISNQGGGGAASIDGREQSAPERGLDIRAKKARRPRSVAGARKRSPTLRTSGGKAAKPAEVETTSTRRRRAPGASPTALVDGLIKSGYFKSPRTLADVRGHLKDARGHQIPVTTLSPIFTKKLRAGDLVRERNQDGVYQYQTP